MNEIWKQCPKDSSYEASSFGRIRNIKTGRVLATRVKKGYLTCKTYCNGRQMYRFVHRLVCEAFIGCSNLTVNHKNFDKADNRIENLEYMTVADNVMHSILGGRTKSVKLVAIDQSGNTIGVYNTMAEASKNTGCSISGVRDVLSNKQIQTKGIYFVREKDLSEWSIPQKKVTKVAIENTATGERWDSMADAAKTVGVARNTISDWCHGKRHSKSGIWKIVLASCLD